MVEAVLEHLLQPLAGLYCDGTTGTAGHSLALLERLDPKGRLVCIDQDPVALDVARERLGDQGGRVRFHRGSFSELDAVLAAESADGFDGILLDLGLNSYTIERPEAGLTYMQDVPLHMAVDPDVPVNAAEYLRTVTEADLAQDFRDFGDLRRAALYARRIVEVREQEPLLTTRDLVRTVSGRGRGTLGASEMSRIFQAVRVVVLEEMPRLERFLERAVDWVRPGGRVVFLTYASHEDRRVKHSLGRKDGPFVPLQKKPMAPSRAEIAKNRRARSAKLRAYERKGKDV